MDNIAKWKSTMHYGYPDVSDGAIVRAIFVLKLPGNIQGVFRRHSTFQLRIIGQPRKKFWKTILKPFLYSR